MISRFLAVSERNVLLYKEKENIYKLGGADDLFTFHLTVL